MKGPGKEQDDHHFLFYVASLVKLEKVCHSCINKINERRNYIAVAEEREQLCGKKRKKKRRRHGDSCYNSDDDDDDDDDNDKERKEPVMMIFRAKESRAQEKE